MNSTGDSDDDYNDDNFDEADASYGGSDIGEGDYTTESSSDEDSYSAGRHSSPSAQDGATSRKAQPPARGGIREYERVQLTEQPPSSTALIEHFRVQLERLNGNAELRGRFRAELFLTRNSWPPTMRKIELRLIRPMRTPNDFFIELIFDVVTSVAPAQGASARGANSTVCVPTISHDETLQSVHIKVDTHTILSWDVRDKSIVKRETEKSIEATRRTPYAQPPASFDIDLGGEDTTKLSLACQRGATSQSVCTVYSLVFTIDRLRLARVLEVSFSEQPSLTPHATSVSAPATPMTTPTRSTLKRGRGRGRTNAFITRMPEPRADAAAAFVVPPQKAFAPQQRSARQTATSAPDTRANNREGAFG